MNAYLDAQVAARRAIHDQFAVPATFYDAGSTTGVPVMVRWHPRVAHTGIGDLDNQGYATVLEAVNRVVFDADEVAAKSVSLLSGASINIPSARVESFILVSAEDLDGPVNLIWNVE